MRRLIRAVQIGAFAIGPCAGYLAWAITHRRPVHIALALGANFALWIGGPTFVAACAAVVLHHQ